MSAAKNTDPDLLPCPFCGSGTYFCFGRDDDIVNVRCERWGSGCLGAGSNESSLGAAVKAWNTRFAAGTVKGEPEPVAWRYRFVTSEQRDWSDWFIVDDAKSIPNRPLPDLEIQPLYTAPPAGAGMREAVRRLEELDCLYVNGERYPFGGIVGDPETATRREAIKECIAALTAPGATTKSDGGESFVTTNPDGSVTLDAYAGKSRDELKARCRELCQHLNEWQFIAMEAATAHGNCLSNVPENARAKIANMIEAYRDDTPVQGAESVSGAHVTDRTGGANPPTGSSSDVEALAATTAERPGTVTSEPEPSTSDTPPVPQAVKAVGVDTIARICADDLVPIIETATRVANRTGNTFVIDRQKVATMIAGHFNRALLAKFKMEGR